MKLLRGTGIAIVLSKCFDRSVESLNCTVCFPLFVVVNTTEFVLRYV